ncbi:hypothetical protein ACFVYA_31810 [Amycolatopsis sp. NPDC058278]
MSIRDRSPSIQEVFLSDRPAGETAEPGRRPALAILRIVLGLTFL